MAYWRTSASGAWNNASNWRIDGGATTGIPGNWSQLVVNRSSTGNQFVNTFDPAGGNYQGSYFDFQNNSTTSGAPELMSLYGSTQGSATNNILYLGWDTHLRFDFPNTPYNVRRIAYWYNKTRSITANINVYKRGNVILALRGPVLTAGETADWARFNWTVEGGGLIGTAHDSLGLNWVSLNGDATSFAALNASAASAYAPTISTLYVAGNNCLLGSYDYDGSYDASNRTNYNQNYPFIIPNVSLRPTGTTLKPIRVTGHPVDIYNLYHDLGDCGFEKVGRSVLRIYNQQNNFYGHVQCSWGTLGASNGSQTLYIAHGAGLCNASIGDNQYVWFLGTVGGIGGDGLTLGNLASSGVFTLPTGVGRLRFGNSGRDATYTGKLTGSGSAGSEWWKVGAGTATLTPTTNGASDTDRPFIVYDGTLVAGNGNAFGANSANGYLYCTNAGTFRFDADVNKSAAYVYVERENAAPALWVSSGSRTLTCNGLAFRRAGSIGAAAGCTLRINTNLVTSEPYAVGTDVLGFDKVGAGTVILNATTTNHKGVTYVKEGTLSFDGKTLSSIQFNMAGGKLTNTTLGSGCTLTCTAATSSELESFGENTTAGTVSVPATAKLTLRTEATSNGLPAASTGTGALTVGGEVRMPNGTVQKGRMVYKNSSVTFQPLSQIVLGV